MAERLAENAHDMWAKTAKEESEALGGGIPPQIVFFLSCFGYCSIETFIVADDAKN